MCLYKNVFIKCMCAILTILTIKRVCVCVCVCVCLATPLDLQDLSFLTRDQTQVLTVKTLNPCYWTARKFPCIFHSFFFKMVSFKNIYLFIYLFICLSWVFVAACRLSLVMESKDYSLIAVCWLLIAVASLLVEHGLQGALASVVVVHRLSCPETCGIFLDQDLNLCPLH